MKNAVLKNPLPKKILFFTVIFLCWIVAADRAFPGEEGKSLVPITLKGKKIKVELAITEAEKEKGLMFRENVGKDSGMLFVYDDEKTLGFWMKNTRVPLSIAFIDKTGKIVDLQDMEPFSLAGHLSARPAKYALEMNQGWFKKNGIGMGDTVKLPADLPK